MAVGKDGFVYATDSSRSEIKKFTSEGAFVSKWEGKSLNVPARVTIKLPDHSSYTEMLTPTPADGYFSGLGSISVDSVTGNIYVTDSCNAHECRDIKKRVQVFSPF